MAGWSGEVEGLIFVTLPQSHPLRSSPDNAAQQVTIGTRHQALCLFDQAQGAPPLGAGFPFHATRETVARKDHLRRHIMRGRRETGSPNVDNREQQIEAPALKARRRPGQRIACWSGTGKAPHQPRRRAGARDKEGIVRQHERGGHPTERITQPDVVRPVSAAEHDVTPIGRDAIRQQIRRR